MADATGACCHDARKVLLNGSGNYDVAYRKLEVDVKHSRRPWCRTYTMRRCPGDLINLVDLAIEHGESQRPSISGLIKSVSTWVEGWRIDGFECDDLEAQINASAALHGRQPIHAKPPSADDAPAPPTIVVPLALAPLHATDLVMPAPQYHEVWLEVEFLPHCPRSTMDSVAFYAHVYRLDPAAKARLRAHPHEFLTSPSRWFGSTALKAGTNVRRLDLGRKHLHLRAICFWVSAAAAWQTRVKHVRILLNSSDVLLDGPPEATLKRVEWAPMGDGGAPSTCAFVAEVEDLCRADTAELVIDYDGGDSDALLQVVGVTLQPIRYYPPGIYSYSLPYLLTHRLSQQQA